MESKLKALTVILVTLTFALAGYYLYTQRDQVELALDSTALSAELFSDVEKYIERREQLSRIKIDVTIFKDSRFDSLVSFSTDLVEQPVGRANPFDETSTPASF